MEAVKMAIKALTETVEAGSKNIEVRNPALSCVLLTLLCRVPNMQKNICWSFPFLTTFSWQQDQAGSLAQIQRQDCCIPVLVRIVHALQVDLHFSNLDCCKC